MRGLNPYDDAVLKAEGARDEITTHIGLPNFPAVYPPIALIGLPRSRCRYIRWRVRLCSY